MASRPRSLHVLERVGDPRAVTIVALGVGGQDGTARRGLGDELALQVGGVGGDGVQYCGHVSSSSLEISDLVVVVVVGRRHRRRRPVPLTTMRLELARHIGDGYATSPSRATYGGAGHVAGERRQGVSGEHVGEEHPRPAPCGLLRRRPARRAAAGGLDPRLAVDVDGRGDRARTPCRHGRAHLGGEPARRGQQVDELVGRVEQAAGVRRTDRRAPSCRERRGEVGGEPGAVLAELLPGPADDREVIGCHGPMVVPRWRRAIRSAYATAERLSVSPPYVASSTPSAGRARPGRRCPACGTRGPGGCRRSASTGARRSPMSRLLRPPAASRATSRSRAVSGSTPGAAGQRRRAQPAGPGGQLGRALGGGGGRARLAARARWSSASSAAASAAQAEDVDRLVPVDDVGEGVEVAVDHGPGVGARGPATSGPSTTSASSSQPVDGLARRRRGGRGRGAARLERCAPRRAPADAATSRMRARADGRSPRQASSQARVRSRVAERRGHRAVADPSARAQRRRGRLALAEQQVALGHADVGPHQRRVLPGRARPSADCRRNRRIASRPRPVSRAISASAISNHTHAPMAFAARARSAAGSSSRRASA